MSRSAIAPVATRGLLAACAALLFACEPEPPSAAFPVTFLARADEPLAGVAIAIEGGRRLGVTGPDGALRVTLSGREGSTVPFRVTCPADHRPPREMPALALRRFTGLDPATAARGIEVSIECPPARRRAALVLRSGQPGLPVLARGREVARTDADGVAHALLELPPHSTFRVVLDTSSHPRLRPQNPATTLALADTDEIFLIEQPFDKGESRRSKPSSRRPRRKRRRPAVERPAERPPVEQSTAPEELK